MSLSEKKFVIMNSGANPHAFSINVLPEWFYGNNERNRTNKKQRFSNRELEWMSELWIEINFDTKDMFEVKKNRENIHDEKMIKALFQLFLDGLPEESKELEKYQKNRKEKRLEWLFEA